MSDICVDVLFDDTPQRQTPSNRKRKRNRAPLKKNSEQRGSPEGKQEYDHRMGRTRYVQAPPRRNGAVTNHPSAPSHTHNNSLPHSSSSSAGTSHPSAKPSTSNQGPVNTSATHCPSASSSHKQTSAGIPAKYLAIDCEMVGSGPKGHISQLARCSLVSYDGDVVYDKFIKPAMPVTDFRTRWSGIRRCDLVNAVPHSDARKEIVRLLMGKVVIGHAIHNDFKALGYSHPAALTRDTSRIPLLNQKAGFAATECASLKRLTKAIFNRDIQTGKKGHSSVEDARATMELYKVVEEEWEKHLASKSQAS
ncbi:interferon-stimulated 20 kDa exonuclease-like 2 [Dicentrarchus labrax]|uniref:Exonuclease domain-containing protein n=1 Tax=Dicentrarchus labrax TaxID=13489 RepID=A0A8P4KTZ7_DICLA|nr:interferon-stimulated 20 kDa exonuclease-like 2 [Dicentrarchus labrax]